MKYYTIGEIFRLGLLKNHDGVPYRHKGTVSRYVSHMKHQIRKTKWGNAKEIPESEIEKFNKH